MQIALLNNEGLQASYNELGISEAQYVQASLPPNPTVFLQKTVAPNGFAFTEAVIGNLFALVTLPARRDIAETQFQAAQLRAIEATLRLTADVRRQYWRAVAAQELVRLLNEARGSAGASADLAKALGQSGGMNKLDQSRDFAFYAEISARLSDARVQENVEHERLASMADGWWRIDPAIGETGARARLYRLGPARYLDRIVLAWARAGAEAADVAWRELATLPERWQAPLFPLKAADLIARGVPKGPQLGRALAAAEEKWISAGLPNAAPALQRILDEAALGDDPHSGARRRREPGTQEH